MPNTVILIDTTTRGKKRKPPTLWIPKRQQNIKGTYLFVHTSQHSDATEDAKPEWIIAERQYGIRCIPLSFTTKKFAIEMAKDWWSQLPQSFIDWLVRVDMSYDDKTAVHTLYCDKHPIDFHNVKLINRSMQTAYQFHPGVK
jgi:hypothetical protein